MSRRYSSADARRRILATCTRLFVRNGYKDAKMSDIMKLADVSTSTFHNIFGTKDGVLGAIMQFVFTHQFDTVARHCPADQPAATLAIRAAVLLALTEQNEPLRELYVKSYTLPKIAEFIYQRATADLCALFSADESSMYELSIGITGALCAYIGHPCSPYFPLERKTTCCLQMLLESLHLPEPDRQQALDCVAQLDIPAIAAETQTTLFRAMEREFHCRLRFPAAAAKA